MRFQKLDLNLLVALDNLIELRSVTATAERMHMSQSAVSNSLSRLRHYFDDDLLVQVGRRMELTARAEELRIPVRDVLVRIESGIIQSQDFDPVESERIFKIILSDNTLTILMPQVLALAEEQGARVGFELMPQQREPFLSVESGEADIVIAPQHILHPGLPSELLWQDSFVCVAWSVGRFGQSAPSLQDYSAARHVRMAPPGGAPSFEQQQISALGIERTVDVTCFSFAAMAHLVVGTDRLATVHSRLARKLANALPVVIHPLPFDLPKLDTSMQWHSYKSRDPGIKWLRNLLNMSAQRIGMP